ncbi:AAA family ATPase [Leuconostoc gelidum subsp. gasicomitatum]|uniref:AAA family ATPase n=1 Tax=Leuconostoc gasicomitatum TaxID=115778 RepID=UPI001CC6E498|nr:AAA family ATPase [Leuconostoc gasicomitatum]MBZ5984135.1 AAA family ATPase [Leuconostoc gasicomitatum]
MADNIFTDLKEVSDKIIQDDKKVTLLYAFNATGKTRLSMTFKEQLNYSTNNSEDVSLDNRHVLYFNSFTEDLFTWENDLENDENRYLIYKTNTVFGKYIYEQGLDQRINKKFSSFVNSNIFTKFEHIENTDNMSIKFYRGDKVIKISRGEERLFTWCVFLIIAQNIMSDLKDDKDDDNINSIDYIYIDDPVSSLDENYTIAAALDLSDLIKESVLQTEKEKKAGKSLKFIISTHHALFFEVLSNSFKKLDSKTINILEKNIDGSGGYVLKGTNNSPFSYHNYILRKIKKTSYNDLSKYHFNLMRNLLEKTALFLGYSEYQKLIPEESKDRSKFLKLLNEYSHGTHPDAESSLLSTEEKNLFKEKFKEFKDTYHWNI